MRSFLLALAHALAIPPAVFLIWIVCGGRAACLDSKPQLDTSLFGLVLLVTIAWFAIWPRFLWRLENRFLALAICMAVMLPVLLLVLVAFGLSTASFH